MNDENILKLLNFDTLDKMPSLDEPVVEIITVDEKNPALVIKKRVYEEHENLFTIETLENQVKECERAIMVWQTKMEKWKAILEWAKKQDRIIPLNEAEGNLVARIIMLTNNVKRLKGENQTPEKVLEIKKLKEEIASFLSELRPQMLDFVNKLTADL